MPLNETVVPASCVPKRPSMLTWASVICAGPRPEPYSTMISPGAIGPVRLLAPLVTAVIVAEVPVKPACETETDTPAIEMMAERPPPALAATARVMVAVPAPEDAPETVIQLGKPETVQEQEGVVCMPTVKLRPEAGACNDVGATE